MTLLVNVRDDRPAAGRRRHLKMGEKELKVLQPLAAGQRNRGIAAELHISGNTVTFHLRNLYRKIGASSGMEAMAPATATARADFTCR